MAANDIDILVLGRQANVRYVTGAPQLWVAGTRPFGPICEVIRATGEIHLNSTWDEGIPDEIGHDHLYGLAWNPMTLIDVLKQLPGAATVRRVGTDSLTPTFAQLLPMAFPNAELVDAEPALRAARRIKTADEVAVLRGALGVAEHALEAARAELAPGVSEQSLTGAMMEAMAAGGVTTPATQDGAWITPKDHSWRRDSTDGRVADGDLVALSAGALADGYVGEVGRTWPVGDVPGADALFRRSNELWERLIAACRPGGSAADLLVRVRGGRGAAARDARRARPRSRVRPAGGLGGPAGHLRRGAPRAGHGAGGHRICLAVRCRSGVLQGRRADRRRRRRGAHVQPHVRRRRGDGLSSTQLMASGERPSPEEIVLYDKDPETKIATITFNRPDHLNAPTSAARLRYADLLRGATVDDDVKVVVIRGVGDDFGSGADLPDFMAGDGGGPARGASGRRPERHVSARRAPSATARRWASGTPTLRRATARCRSSRRSASSRPRATATAGTSTSAPTPTW